ncbi:MAG: DUF2384 domain-containing protein [Sphingobacteriaceae bacterium]|nr:MAG: DUF2384 domain-containing protein [Sphingobacteriaceae bacterium]
MIKKSGAKNSITVKKTVENTLPKKSMVKEALTVYQALCADPISLLSNSKKGLDAQAAIDFLNLSGFTQEEFQETFKTTVKTIQNYNRHELKLDAATSEKLLKSFVLFEKGIEVFGSAKDFNDWLHQSAFGLGNQIPLEMMDTITGIGLIEDEIVRIAYGDLA